MPSRRTLDYILLVLAVALTRFFFRSRCLYDSDSVNFALALGRFDPSVDQPHPPGYFLYICLGRLVRLLLPDATTALFVISIVASCGAVVMIYFITEAWFGPRAAIFSGLLFLFSPLCWFHGEVALTYIVEAFFSALVGYLCWRCFKGDLAYLIPSSIALGLAAGFRQSSVLMLGLLWLASARKGGWSRVWLASAALLATVLLWFVPMVQAAGGLRAYFTLLYEYWRRVHAAQTVLTSPIAMPVARLSTIFNIYLLFAGAAAWLPLAAPAGESDREKKAFTWLWVSPGLLYFTFIYLRFSNSGYLLVFSPPILAWSGHWAARCYDRSLSAPVRKLAVVGTLAAFNAAVFLYAPVYCSYKSVRDFEAELAGISQSLRSLVSPQDTVIVGFDSHFLDYRHAAYYLPEYLTVRFPEVESRSGRRIFVVRNRSTSLVRELPAEGIKSFVLFPLPDRPEYTQFLSQLRAKFPPGALRATVAGGREFSTGRVADLSILFPPAPGRAAASTSR